MVRTVTVRPLTTCPTMEHVVRDKSNFVNPPLLSTLGALDVELYRASLPTHSLVDKVMELKCLVDSVTVERVRQVSPQVLGSASEEMGIKGSRNYSDKARRWGSKVPGTISDNASEIERNWGSFVLDE
jgi:hypothetical protein